MTTEEKKEFALDEDLSQKFNRHVINHIAPLVKGDVVKQLYNSKFLNVLREVLEQRFIKYKLIVTILDNNMELCLTESIRDEASDQFK